MTDAPHHLKQARRELLDATVDEVKHGPVVLIPKPLPPSRAAHTLELVRLSRVASADSHPKSKA